MTIKTKIGVVHFPSGEIEPLFVAARDVLKVIVGISAKTLSNWRSEKKGPPFHMVGGTLYYAWEELKEFFSAGRIETFNGRKNRRDSIEVNCGFGDTR